MNLIDEYWLETENPRGIAVVEAESTAPFAAVRMDWGELFEIEVFPAVTGEEGREMLREAMSEQG